MLSLYRLAAALVARAVLFLHIVLHDEDDDDNGGSDGDGSGGGGEW